MDKVFLDTSFVIALLSPKDTHHSRALALKDQMRRDHTAMLTTRAILLEIGDGLSQPENRAAAVALVRSLESDRSVEIVEITPDLFSRALRLYQERPDKGWGLTDCAAFVVMEDAGVSEALTSDHHFEQAGFRALLREGQRP